MPPKQDAGRGKEPMSTEAAVPTTAGDVALGDAEWCSSSAIALVVRGLHHKGFINHAHAWAASLSDGSPEEYQEHWRLAGIRADSNAILQMMWNEFNKLDGPSLQVSLPGV